MGLHKFFKSVFKDEYNYLGRYIGSKLPYWWRMKQVREKYGRIHRDLPSDYKCKIKSHWGKYNIKVSFDAYKYFYASNQIQNVFYIPEDVFVKYFIRKLNYLPFAWAYSDKNIYNKLFPFVDTPRSCIIKFAI